MAPGFPSESSAELLARPRSLRLPSRRSRRTAAGRRLLERIGRDPSVKARFADLRRIDTEIAAIATVFNDAWADNWGFVPSTLEEVAHMAKELRPFITNESMTVIQVDGMAEAFAFALPNLLDSSDGQDGRLLPFGWARVLTRHLTRPIRSQRLALMGVKRRYRDNPLACGARLLAIEQLARIAQARHRQRRARGPGARDHPPHAADMLEDAGARQYKTPPRP